MTRLLPLFLASALTGCDVIGSLDGGDEDDEGTATEDAGMSVDRENYDDTTNTSGLVEIPIEVSGNTSAFHVTVESDKYPTLEELIDPDGNQVLYWEDWYYSDESLTSAFFAFGKTMSLNWPVRSSDGPLDSGTWTAVVSTIDNNYQYAGREDVEVTVMTKDDGRFSEADVRVRIVWADGVDEDEDAVAGVEGAVERWREVWANYGLNLVESYHTSDLDPDLGFADNGSGDVEDNAERFDGQELILIVGDTYDSLSGYSGTYGVAGGIPGSIEPNRLTYVTISWLAHAGGNGSFSDDEIRLMGETAAHECGHFMGLFHPVESHYNYWDALSDTDDCTNQATCENKLGDNLMFPYPICSYTSCDPQGELTDNQKEVSQRYIGSL